MIKKFDHHESCPQCGSADNVAVWSDGQKWCFGGCGYYIPGSTTLSKEDLRQRLHNLRTKETKKNGTAYLPFDFTLLLPSGPLAWLRQYGITDAERFRFKLGWSDFYESLILPSYDLYGNLLVCQRRYFGKEGFPKYHTSGYPESVIWTVRPNFAEKPTDTFNGTLVVVEDVVSAIKVGRYAEATPLWGSNWSLDKLNRVSDRWKSVLFWLDFNKTAEAMKFKVEAEPFFETVGVLSTEKDPKANDDGKIKQILADAEDCPF